MRLEIIMVMLRDYNANKARLAHLELAANELRAAIEKEELNILRNEALRTPDSDGMPKGNAITSTVENIAIKVADGWTPEYLEEMKQELTMMVTEKSNLSRNIAYVDAWLSGLNEKQAWVIRNHIIQDYSWYELMVKWRKEFDSPTSRNTLKRLKDTALETMQKVSVGRIWAGFGPDLGP